MRLLQESAQLQELLMDSDGQCQSILRPQVEAEADGEPLEMEKSPEKAEKAPEKAVNPFAKPQPDQAHVDHGKAVGNPFQTKFAQMSPKAGSVHLSPQKGGIPTDSPVFSTILDSLNLRQRLGCLGCLGLDIHLGKLQV